MIAATNVVPRSDGGLEIVVRLVQSAPLTPDEAQELLAIVAALFATPTIKVRLTDELRALPKVDRDEVIAAATKPPDPEPVPA